MLISEKIFSMDDFKSQLNGNIRLVEVMGSFLYKDHLEELVDYLIIEPTEEDTKEQIFYFLAS